MAIDHSLVLSGDNYLRKVLLSAISLWQFGKLNLLNLILSKTKMRGGGAGWCVVSIHTTDRLVMY